MQQDNPEIELRERGFIPKDILQHDEIMNFVKPWLAKKNIYTLIYNGMNLLFLLLLGAFAGMMMSAWEFRFDIVRDLLFGVGIAFLLIPFHELLHGAAYKWVGAPQVQYRVIWKKLIFYAMADKFITDYPKFRIVGLTPFIVVTVLAVSMVLIFGMDWFYVMVGLIGFHSACCGGDFALLSYMHEHREIKPVTYDDIDAGKSYFWVKEG